MHKFVCNKCGRDDLAPLREERFAVVIELPGKTLTGHLCEQCGRDLAEWFETPYAVTAP